MQSFIDINQKEWCDIIFKGKNKNFGAYVLRKEYHKQQIKSLIIASILFALALLSPSLIKTVLPEKKVKVVEVTSLANVKNEPIKQKEEIIDAPPPPPLKSSIKFTPPVIKPDEEVQEVDEIKRQDELSETKVAISVADIQGQDDNEAAVDVAELDKNQEITQETEEEIFVVVEQMPEFPGGEIALRQWIAENVKYPVMASENGVQGKVYVQFVVDKDGRISNARIARGVDPSLDKEALRVVNSLPRWNPGRQRGEPVRVSYTVPINFVLD